MVCFHLWLAHDWNCTVVVEMRNTRLSTTMQKMNFLASPMVQHHILESWMNGFISTDHPIWDKHHLEPRTGLPKNELHNNCSMTHKFGKNIIYNPSDHQLHILGSNMGYQWTRQISLKKNGETTVNSHPLCMWPRPRPSRLVGCRWFHVKLAKSKTSIL